MEKSAINDRFILPLKKMRRVGFWISDKKYRKLNWSVFEDYCRERNIELIRIDLNFPLESQGPFDLVIHKVSDVVIKSNHGCLQAQKQLPNFMVYLQKHPEVIVLDPIENVRHLLDRSTLYSIVKDCSFEAGDNLVITPNFVELISKDVEANKKLMEMAGVKYPFVMKARVSQCLDMAHQMAIIFNEDGLKDITPPCVAQTFVNHNAVLYKIFVIGDNVFCVERPSVKNFYSKDHETIFFDSSTISRHNSDCQLNQLDTADQKGKTFEPNQRLLHQIGRAMRDQLGLDLIGIDVVIGNTTGNYAVIDINYFPGYEGLTANELFESLVKIIKHNLETRRPKPVHNDDAKTMESIH